MEMFEEGQYRHTEVLAQKILPVVFVAHELRGDVLLPNAAVSAVSLCERKGQLVLFM